MAVQDLDSLSAYIVADSLGDAAQLAVDHFKSVAVEKKCRGFVVPKLVHEDIVLRDGAWTRAFEFTTELLPADVSS